MDTTEIKTLFEYLLEKYQSHSQMLRARKRCYEADIKYKREPPEKLEESRLLIQILSHQVKSYRQKLDQLFLRHFQELA